jgi:hypothetical protein
MNFPNFRRCRVAPEHPSSDAAPEPAPSLQSPSLIERAVAAAPLSGTRSDRRSDALWRAAAFADVFGADGFRVVERAGWWSVTAPELDELTSRCKVAFRLQGGSSPLDPPMFVIGGVEVASLAELGAVVAPMLVLAELRSELVASGADVGAVSVSASSVSLPVNGAVVSVDADGSLRATTAAKGRSKAASSVTVSSASELCAVTS